jgi:type II secretory pathway pseudopilin PulG
MRTIIGLLLTIILLAWLAEQDQNEQERRNTIK